jgi:hypothetical protein
MAACATEIPGLELMGLAEMARLGYEREGLGAMAVHHRRGEWLASYISARRLRSQGVSEEEIGRAIGRYDPRREFVALVADGDHLTRIVYRARPWTRAYG